MKILVIQTAFPGDAILTLPLIQEIYNKFSFPQIDVLCIPSTKIIFNSNPAVNKTIVFDKKGRDKGINAFLKLVKKIKSEKYDKVFSPHRSTRSSLLSFFSNSKESVSFNNSSLSFLYKKKIEYRKDWHEVRRNLSLLDKNYDDESWKILPKIKISEAQKKIVDEKSKLLTTRKLIAIAPGSVWETKRYPAEYFKIIAKNLVKEEFEVVIIGGKEDFELAEEIRETETFIHNYCGEFDFVESIYLLSKTLLLISNDSAPTHLGMCADIPVLTVYCSTVPGFGFYPYNKTSEYISYDDLKCKPCGIHGYHRCPEKHFNCALKLHSKVILEKVFAMLGERNSQHN